MYDRIGNCRIIGEIGSGGMAVIYKATDLSLQRTVAVKILRPSLTVDPQFLARFQNEGRAIANLTTPTNLLQSPPHNIQYLHH